MSELIQHTTRQDGFRRQLTSTVSATTLLFLICAPAAAQDTDKPTVWIELGGQLEALSGTQDRFAPAFLVDPLPLEARPWGPVTNSVSYGIGTLVDPGFPDPFAPEHPLQAQKPPHYAFGGEAKASFQPRGSDWVFAASLRYGRSNGNKSIQRNIPALPYVPRNSYNESMALFVDSRASYSESHAVLDFQVGRDVGLGLLGRDATSILNFGVRFAQLVDKSNVRVDADPNVLAYRHTTVAGLQFSAIGAAGRTKYSFRFQTYQLRAQSERSFHGIGPALSWNGSAPVIGNSDNMELALDWGVNGAVLFGRQKAEVSHHTAHHDRLLFHKGALYDRNTLVYDSNTNDIRAKSVTVPNIGAFAGLSVNFPNAKVSLGYRADFFFGAMDAGIDTRHTEDMSFHGPFAKISIGLGG